MYKKLLLVVTLALSTCFTNIGFASQVEHQVIVKNGANASIQGAETIFTGNVRVDPMFSNIDNREISGAYVTFEPQARSAWHTHPKGQILMVTQGQGLTQEWGKPIEIINPGDIVWCPPGIKHWHGGGYKTSMTHISLCEAVNGINVNWLEKVTDEQYFNK